MTLSEHRAAAHATGPSAALESAATDRALAPATSRVHRARTRRPAASTLLVLACALTGLGACARTPDSTSATTAGATTPASGSSVARTRPASTAADAQGAAGTAASAAPAPSAAGAAPPASPPAAATAATTAAPRTAATRTDTVATAGGLPRVLVHKSASCGCCGQWVDHMRQAGFTVEVRDVDNVTPVKERLGVPYGKGSCHTAEVGGYFVEGHVPAEDIKRLLAQKPDARGLVLPGMPAGSPGMEMPDGRVQPYTVELVAADGTTSDYAHHGH